MIKYLFSIITIMTLSACSTLPSQGPSSMDIALLDSNNNTASNDYAVVQLDEKVVHQVGGFTPTIFSDDFSKTLNTKEHAALGIGDKLRINIWEATSEGLFSTEDQKGTTIETVVNEKGEVYIPYVGQISVDQKSIEDVRLSIENVLKGQAVEPQVQVSLIHNVSNNVVIVGDVNKPGQYPISVSGLQLMEALARAGGSKQAAFESQVYIVRGDKHGSVRLADVVNYPKNNIWLSKRDTVEVLHKPLSYSAFGAVTSKNLLPFKTESVSLAEALAQAGGLNDNLADAGGVFLFRFEKPDRMNQLVNTEGQTLYDGSIATIYRLDFNQPKAFFLASSFTMHDKDIIYVANAPAVEFNKFMSTFVTPVLGTTVNVKRIAE